MVKGNALLLVLGLLLQQFALVESAGVRPQNNRVLDECDGVSNDECNGGGSSETPEHGTGSTPNRVSQVNKNGADCAPAANSERGGDTLPKIITFYYRIDSPSEIGPDQVKEIENRIFQTILPAIVWCILPPEPEDDVSGGNRMLPESTDDLTLMPPEDSLHIIEEARRLGIISFGSGGFDRPVDSFRFGDNDPCNSRTDAECVVVEGKMSMLAHVGDGLQLIVASILDATQSAMDENRLVHPGFANCQSMCEISKVTWLGETFNQVLAGAEAGGDTGGGGPPVVVVTPKGNPDEFEGDALVRPPEEERRRSVLVFAAVPLAILLLLAFLFAKNKKRRTLIAGGARGLDTSEDFVLVGTGDPPRSFHEGMYHYTRSGARYLSTNCEQCAETRRMGFFTDADLATINEGQLYDPSSPTSIPVGQGASFDDFSAGSQEETINRDLALSGDLDDSAHRKTTLVQPSSGNLGAKHSSIDVHECTSATCRICAYKPKDVEFVASPVSSPTNRMFTTRGSSSGGGGGGGGSSKGFDDHYVV